MKDVDIRVQHGLSFGKTRGFLKTGDSVVVVTGWQQGSGFTNTLRIVYVDDDDDTSCLLVSDNDSYDDIY